MRWGSRRSLIVCAGLATVFSAAYAAGRAHLDGLISLGSFAAVALSLVAIFRPTSTERIGGAALLSWIVLAAWTEQFAWAASSSGIIYAAVWLLPPIVGGVVLPTSGHWWSGVGCWAATFAGVAATTYSVHSIYSGAGLFFLWES
jgi:hypothetical protein